MLWRHYHRAVTQQNAREFWKIKPPKIDGKTIRFVAACLCEPLCRQAF